MNHLIPILDEQVAVKFTGKVNIINSNSKQNLGQIIIIDGEICEATYLGNKGIKGFYNLYLDEFDNKPLSFISEPEMITKSAQNIPYPYSILKQKLVQLASGYAATRNLKPAKDLKLLINSEFIEGGTEISANEFKVMCTLSDYNLVKDIYQNCDLLDFEITNTLVSLRKKGALKVIKQITKDDR